MALNFPNSPTDGQVYTDSTTGNRYVYNLGSGRWNYTTNGVTMSVASSPPGNPNQGNLWWNQDYGRLFVYYTDVDTSQWVEANPVPDFGAAYAFANTAANTTANAANAYTVTVGAASNNYANSTFTTIANGAAAFNKANTLANSSYSIVGSLQKSSFVASTTYYFGAHPQSTLSTTADVNRVYIPKSGTITRIYFSIFNNAGVAGSAQTVPIFLRLNNTTDYLAVNAVLNMASSTAAYNVNVSSITVSSGDYFEFKQVSPAWSPSPTNIQYGWQVFIDG